MDLFKKLSEVQKKLNVPKNNYNEFGKFNYRSCEDIVEAVKPLLAENGLTMTISDELVMVGDRYYIKANVAIIDIETGEKHEVTAYAREAEQKKGMDESQITGASSSYARKYALNGMFAIDDTKDADAMETETKKQTKKTTQEQIKAETIDEIMAAINENEKAREYVKELLKKAGYKGWNGLAKFTESDGRDILANIKELGE